MVQIDQSDFDEILQMERNKEGRNPARETYRKRVERAYEELLKSAQDGEKITYGEIMDEIGTGRNYIGSVLDGVSRLELRKGNPPLSAIVVRKDTRMPGEGFWNLLESHGIWSPGDDGERVWREQVERIFDHW